MDNKTIAKKLQETADLMEIAGEDSFRIRSYLRAAESIDSLPQQIAEIIGDEKKVLDIPGIGKGMLGHLKDLCSGGDIEAHALLLKKYGTAVLELLQIQGLGPKTIALIWDSFQVSDLTGVEKLAREGKLRTLPRMGEKQEAKILKGIEDHRRISGRFLIDDADRTAQKIIAHLKGVAGVDKITPAGSLRRGRETVGDLDMLVTGKGCQEGSPHLRKIISHILKFEGIETVLGEGENKVSFKLASGMQVDVRLLAPESYGSALLYFTGSKSHNVSLRQRAIKMGYSLNEYVLSREKDGKFVASKTELEIYKKLGLEYIPPELRENSGEIEAAENNQLPELITQDDLQGDVHIHTVATDGKNSIEEMAEAAHARGYKYMAITDHSKNLAMANGLDDHRAMQHIKKIRAVASKMDGIRVFSGIEVDILADGQLDLSDGVLEEMDVVIASVHSHFSQEPARMTDRLLKALSNKNMSILGHPTGRHLLKRDAYAFDIAAILDAAKKNKVAMELNSAPARLDLNDLHLRMARDRGVKIVINTDSHHTTHMDNIKYGIMQARRAWLTRTDVLNTLPPDKFARAMKRA